MSGLQFHLDEDCQASALATALREHGLDVSTTNEAKLTGAADATQLRWAAQAKRVLITNNIRDFVPVHSRWLDEEVDPHAGIVLIGQQTLSIGEIVRRLLQMSRSRSPEEMANQLEWLANWRVD